MTGIGHEVRGTAFQLSISLAIPGACWAEVGGVVRASGALKRTSSGSCFGSPAVREHMGPYGHIRGDACCWKRDSGCHLGLLGLQALPATRVRSGRGQNGT